MNAPDRFGYQERREVADELWRLFQLLSPRIAFSFDPGGIIIRIPFNKEQDLDGSLSIHGIIEDYGGYTEVDLADRQT